MEHFCTNPDFLDLWFKLLLLVLCVINVCICAGLHLLYRQKYAAGHLSRFWEGGKTLLCFSIKSKSSEIFSTVLLCVCSWDRTSAPACVRSIWTLMASQICWLALPWQRASPGKREESMCTSTRGRCVHTRFSGSYGSVAQEVSNVKNLWVWYNSICLSVSVKSSAAYKCNIVNWLYLLENPSRENELKVALSSVFPYSEHSEVYVGYYGDKNKTVSS